MQNGSLGRSVEIESGKSVFWTKPQDLEYSDNFPAIGESGSFAAPYRSSNVTYGQFLMGDMSVQQLPKSLDAETLRLMLTIDDGRQPPRQSQPR